MTLGFLLKYETFGLNNEMYDLCEAEKKRESAPVYQQWNMASYRLTHTHTLYRPVRAGSSDGCKRCSIHDTTEPSWSVAPDEGRVQKH